MIEEWKELENYTSYLISNTGKVKNKATGELRPQTVNGGFWCTNLIRDDGVKELSSVNMSGVKKQIGFATVEEASSFYKTSKEDHAKQMADEYRDVLDERVLDKLYNFKMY